MAHVRDSPAIVALLGAGRSGRVAGRRVGAPSEAAWRSEAGRRRTPVAGLAVVVLGLLVGLGSAHGERHHVPLRNVYEVRALPYPDRVEWFADRGMPQAEVFVGPDARALARRAGPPR